MDNQNLIPHLFRTEFQKMVAVLCKQFGLAELDTATDIASDTFLAALETWPYQDVPPNPAAWLYAAAKNKAKNHLSRTKTFEQKVAPAFASSSSKHDEQEIDWTDENIRDSQLEMMFALCHPSLSTEAQIALSLRLLCGFGIDEIAAAFLTGKDTISKRLYRAKETIREKNISLQLPSPTEIARRLNAVLKIIYLLFNEGYYSEGSDTQLRKYFCLEAVRLAHLLTLNERTNVPAVNALLALMCFHASRFDARIAADGDAVLYSEQDESLWDKQLITKGATYLQRAATGTSLSHYHIEASIAFWHTVKDGPMEKWTSILQLYDQLLQLHYTPMAALNRIYAVWKVKGAAAAIREAEQMRFTENRFYHALLGELYKEFDPEKAAANFRQAIALAKSDADKRTLQRHLDALL